MNPIVGQFALGVYAVMLGAGGVVGYRKAGSKPSLIAGSISAALAVAALVISVFQVKLGFWVGAVLGVAMLAFFVPRFLRTKKMMPAGMMSIASLLVIVLLALFLVPV